MTEKLFGTFDVFIDEVFHSAAMNMAIDEALLEIATVPAIRFYRWDHAALSFGYFGKFPDIAAYSDRDAVRRWTGGGIVVHGNDLTYSLVVPAADAAFAEPSMSIYEKVHCALRDALSRIGLNTELVSVAAVSDRRNLTASAVGDRRYNQNACFANPVRADVMMDGRKIAGAAQRRTKRGLLQQGSIQEVDLAEGFEMEFAATLSTSLIPKNADSSVLDRARIIAKEKYATDTWLRRR